MLTIEKLKNMSPGIFQSGAILDNPDGINMTNSGERLRWVAVRGGIHDWVIYCYWADATAEWIRDHGDKVHNENHIKKLVGCDDEAFNMYRH